MSEDSKSTPIPTRFSTEDYEMLDAIAEATGISRSELIRRLVNFGLKEIQSQGSLDFLYGKKPLKDLLKPKEKDGDGGNGE